ncbi:MAG: MoxR family ATPase [Candidatus Marinimicrobia bacterium]|nr:MoxR family ATPase [Candidatus Neomarinimicrobiota bacterium]
MNNIELVENLQLKKDALFNEIGKVIIGQHDIIDHLFISLLCRGHVLLEGVPGLAKTLLIKTLSDALELKFNRIQFTPDLMPSDITGTEIIEEDQSTGKRLFRFFEGPIFANIVLADEINRTPPKTQAALLEAMQEHKVTTGGKTYTLDEPFFVLATQNPIEQEGTYPLPEAQLDRFMFNLHIKYPTAAEEAEIVKSTTGGIVNKLNTAISHEELASFQNLIRKVPVADNVIEFAVKTVGNTRPGDDAPPLTNELLDWGAGPRASAYLILGAKAKALLDGRTTPDIDDVKSMIKPVLRHRIIPNFNAEADGISRDMILEQLMEIS